ncbi:reverse transcriptase [Cucumis melo var. makuwa]|uniref:Reverse transcriptase n=1 Tax=Cucumis melo var. makuwa TaxID=1194695 RepID=A0A5A7THV2_CUCMM|nr:reverse transcriptase [Cucumis melo var. makuwa]TYK15506.1 reverse transcriptase [Cucumis melo var. makuwa]
MLNRLADNKYYCFLDGYSGYNQITIASKDQHKTTFNCPYETFVFCRMPFGLCNASEIFQSLEEVLKRYEETSLVLNWEKCNFMVTEGTVLKHKISNTSLAIDPTKIDMVSKFPSPLDIEPL